MAGDGWWLSLVFAGGWSVGLGWGVWRWSGLMAGIYVAVAEETRVVSN